MKNFNSLILVCLVVQMGSIVANEIPFEILDENKIITQLNQESDSSKKLSINSALSELCPFKEETSKLSQKIQLNYDLQASAKNPQINQSECQSYVDDINSSNTKAQSMVPLINSPDAKFDPATKESYSQGVTNFSKGAGGLHSLLASQCAVQNSNAVVSKSNKVIGELEKWGAALAFVNPAASLVGVGAASVGRLTVGLGGWLFKKPKKDPSEDIKASEQYINDLCAFRDLTYQFDDIKVDLGKLANESAIVKTKDPEIEKRLRARKVEIENELKNSRDLIICSQREKSNLDNLQALSNHLAPFLDKPASQKECINILNEYNDSKSANDLNPIDVLAKRFQCSDPEENLGDRRSISFCRNYKAIEEMALGDLYEKCEDTDFQKNISAKFINLSDLILRNINEDMGASNPANNKIKGLQLEYSSIDDELQLMRETEENDKRLAENQKSAAFALSLSRTQNSNASKAITDIGRNVLGNRFELFAQKTLRSSEFDIKEATGVLKDLVKKNNKLEGKRAFSKNNNEEQKAAAKKDICETAAQVKRQFINGYKSSALVKDVCDFTKGDGIPALKSTGENFDTYSASSSNRLNNLSSKCKSITATVITNNNQIRKQMTVMSGLGCGI